jgi:hypothetical protein
MHGREDGAWALRGHRGTSRRGGGADDGAVVIPGFSLDLQALLAHFDRVEAFQWYPSGLGPYDPEGPCVSIEGLYQGHNVWLRLLAESPAEEEPGLQLASGSPS